MPSLTSLLARLQARTLRRRKIAPKAKALLLDDNGALILIQHPLENHWRLPGGFAHMNESTYDAVVRAVAQLTGLHPQNPQPIARVDESHFRADAMYGDYFQMYATLFLITRWEGHPRPLKPDWKIQTFPQHHLPPNLHPEVPLALRALHTFQQTGQIRTF